MDILGAIILYFRFDSEEFVRVQIRFEQILDKELHHSWFEDDITEVGQDQCHFSIARFHSSEVEFRGYLSCKRRQNFVSLLPITLTGRR